MINSLKNKNKLNSKDMIFYYKKNIFFLNIPLSLINLGSI